MNNRYASNPVDKIAGMTYLLLGADRTRIPAYSANIPVEEAWSRCIKMLKPHWTNIGWWSLRRTGSQQSYDWLTKLLLLFPHPGSGGQWYPSWYQVSQYPDTSIVEKSESWEIADIPTASMLWINALREDWEQIRIYRKCHVRCKDYDICGEQRWEYTMQAESIYDSAIPMDTTLWTSRADFPQPIPDGVYTIIALLRSKGSAEHGESWVVLCKDNEDERYLWRRWVLLRKVAAMRVNFDESPGFGKGFWENILLASDGTRWKGGWYIRSVHLQLVRLPQTSFYLI